MFDDKKSVLNTFCDKKTKKNKKDKLKESSSRSIIQTKKN